MSIKSCRFFFCITPKPVLEIMELQSGPMKYSGFPHGAHGVSWNRAVLKLNCLGSNLVFLQNYLLGHLQTYKKSSDSSSVT